MTTARIYYGSEIRRHTARRPVCGNRRTPRLPHRPRLYRPVDFRQHPHALGRGRFGIPLIPDALGILGLWGVRDWMFNGTVRNIYYFLPSYTTLAPSFLRSGLQTLVVVPCV